MFNEILVAFLIVAVCVLVHVAGILLMAELLLNRRGYLEQKHARTYHAIVMILVFSGILTLHITETIVWAGFYYANALFSDFETSIYFSMTSYTTIGYGDVLLPRNWRLLGVIQGVTGVLLCGISTAFFFAVMTAMFQIRVSARIKQ
jgi:hypothetical protein